MDEGVDVTQLDSYLLPVPMLRHWQPLVTHVVVRENLHICNLSSHGIALHTILTCS